MSIPVRQPLRLMVIEMKSSVNLLPRKEMEEMLKLVAEEVNVKKVVHVDKAGNVLAMYESKKQ